MTSKDRYREHCDGAWQYRRAFGLNSAHDREKLKVIGAGQGAVDRKLLRRIIRDKVLDPG